MTRDLQRGGKRRSSDRVLGKIEPIQTFLIVCEGKRTEPNYFRSFRVPVTVRVHIVGEGYNTVSLVDRAVQLASEQKYDQVWCVFDRDDFPIEAFNVAFQLAHRHHFKVAYSNEAFELWYLLHFHFHQNAIPRSGYIPRLSRELGRIYEKNDPNIYADLLSRQPDAIRNARQLLSQYERNEPARNNPSTSVHMLVEELNKYSPDAIFLSIES